MQLKINDDKRELKSHGQFDFPLLMTRERLSLYERGAFIWHWHPEIELTLITDGRISYQVNERVYELREGQALFCNANALHTGHMIGGEDCSYCSTTFHPRLIYGFAGSRIQNEFVDPIVHNEGFGSLVFSPEIEWQANVIERLRELSQINDERPQACELLMQRTLSDVWTAIFLNGGWDVKGRADAANIDFERLRRILIYIQQHYDEHITLEDVAAQINICKSECCRFFRRHMNQSLFDYLLYYRIEKSLALLGEDRLTVTEVSEKTGFSNPSYFARVFRSQIGCSPGQYRKTRLTAACSDEARSSGEPTGRPQDIV